MCKYFSYTYASCGWFDTRDVLGHSSMGWQITCAPRSPGTPLPTRAEPPRSPKLVKEPDADSTSDVSMAHPQPTLPPMSDIIERASCNGGRRPEGVTEVRLPNVVRDRILIPVPGV